MHRILMSFFRITISPYTVLACARYSDSLLSILSWCQTYRSDIIDEIQTCHLPRKREKVRYFDYWHRNNNLPPGKLWQTQNTGHTRPTSLVREGEVWLLGTHTEEKQVRKTIHRMTFDTGYIQWVPLPVLQFHVAGYARLVIDSGLDNPLMSYIIPAVVHSQQFNLDTARSTSSVQVRSWNF